MPSKELLRAVKQYEKYIEKRGIDESVLDAMTVAVNVAFQEKGDNFDLGYCLELSRKTKKTFNEEIVKRTKGGNVDALEEYCVAHQMSATILEQYYDCVRCEAPYLFNSYLNYLERFRPEKDKFYKPRRKCFRKIGIIQALQDLEDDKLDVLSLSMPPGTGKAQPMYSKVLTPDGFIHMDEVKVGTKVISGTGNVCNVVGVYPQGKKPIYEITFDDGSTCRSSDEHLWTVQTRDDRNKKRFPEGKYRTIMLKDMLHNIRVEHGRKNYSVDYVDRIEFPEKHFDIEPYVMGVLLGDGSLSGGSITLSTADQQLLDTMKMFMPLEYEFIYKGQHDYQLKTNVYYTKGKSKYRKALDKYGLWNAKSDTKFIPREYLTASYEQRLWLLRGLMDTDGTVDKRDGNCSYCTISKQLALDMAELVHSLGGYASISRREKGYKDKNGEYIRCNDAYMLYIRIRDNADLFALDRKKQYCKKSRLGEKRYIADIKYIGEEECQCIYIDDPSHLYITDNYVITHNTTLEKFFITWIIGRDPEGFSLFFSHSGDITRMFYDGILDITTNETEYTWKKIFPNVPLQATNAKAETINFGKYKPFASCQCTSIGSSNSGKVRASKYLCLDDLIGGIEVALNKNQLDKLWNIYSVDARQRKIDGAKELHIATRWSVHDVIGRLQTMYEGNDRARFIAYPDIDPNTGKSNFEYDRNGFSVEFFHEQESAMDEVSYRCLYKNEPIEREGLLYHDDELRRYFDLPDREPDAIIGVCDTKSKGIDYMVLPVVYVYDDDYYMVDCICDDSSDYNLQETRLSKKICDHQMQRVEFESNAGGDRLAKNVTDKVKAMGGRCSITTKPTETNKETRIIVNSNWVKEHILFKDKSLYVRNSDYGRFMNQLLTYSVAGKNAHDDVCDAMANFTLFATKPERKAARIMKNFL